MKIALYGGAGLLIGWLIGEKVCDHRTAVTVGGGVVGVLLALDVIG